jgi:molybdate/tungstate transport system permease protein
LLLLFVLLPLAATLISTSPAELGEALGDPEVGNSLALTLTASAIATVLVMVTGIPLAYLLARRRFPGRRLVESLIDLPLSFPIPLPGLPC